MVKRADFKLIAPQLVALDAFIFVRMVESLHSCVTLVAPEPIRAKVPADTG